MIIRINGVDYEPEDLAKQIPFNIKLIKKMKGTDRDDYWLGKVNKPLSWAKGNNDNINYVIVSSRYVGTTIHKGMGKIVLGLAYVIDETLIDDTDLDFNKCEYVAICDAEEVKGWFRSLYK